MFYYKNSCVSMELNLSQFKQFFIFILFLKLIFKNNHQLLPSKLIIFWNDIFSFNFPRNLKSIKKNLKRQLGGHYYFCPFKSFAILHFMLNLDLFTLFIFTILHFICVASLFFVLLFVYQFYFFRICFLDKEKS